MSTVPVAFLWSSQKNSNDKVIALTFVTPQDYDSGVFLCSKYHINGVTKFPKEHDSKTFGNYIDYKNETHYNEIKFPKVIFDNSYGRNVII